MSDVMAVLRALSRLHHGVCIPDYEKVLDQAYSCFLNPMAPRDMVIIDAGAHVGRHLERFAALARDEGRVIAFEPLPHFAGALRKQFPRAGVEVRELALGRAPGEAAFHYFAGQAGLSGLRQRSDAIAGTAELIRVKVDTLDNQAADLDRLTYIKIDVEGGEMDCLAGGRNTIMRLRPWISVEYGKPSYGPYGHTALSLFEFATELNYTLSDLFGNLIGSEAEWLSICDAVYWDYFMVPRERVDEWGTYFHSVI